MTKKQKKRNDGRSSDLTCRWFVRQYGKQWEAWRAYGEAWLTAQDAGLEPRLRAVTWFFEAYLVGEGLPSAPAELFNSDISLPDLMACIERTMSSSGKYIRNNSIVDFLDWVIARDFSEPDDTGRPVPLVRNPFEKVKDSGNPTETVRNPLPYTYIKELRDILCPSPKGHFSDWTWAQAQSGFGRSTGQGDWFEVDPSLVDQQDPDCVWRERTAKRNSRQQATITEMWSPVRAVALFVKLHLPLRTYQVRMLDSGEADTWRYADGEWRINRQHAFALGTEKAPWQRGVFRRIHTPEVGDVMTGLYVNTNKTADRNKDSEDCGYTVPWEHPDVLYWLEKLRNWQEKYNAIDAPTPWTSLKLKHTVNKQPESKLAAMGESCFLFRDASAQAVTDRDKPIKSIDLDKLWYRLLKTLEDRVAARGQTLSDGTRLRFVKSYDDVSPAGRVATEFPLHSLRVSLITCYAMEGQVPLPVLSKLLAGHSRLLMTVYYTKLTPAVMTEKMDQAHLNMAEHAEAGLRNFLADADLRQIEARTVYRDADSVKAALANRNPLGWERRHIGLCLAGGNNVSPDSAGSVAGCWNGGEIIRDHQSADQCVYGAVPHGPENCVRCRWFITDAQYLNALRAHFNNLSYRATLAANLAVERERDKEALEDARFEAEQADQPFTRHAELKQAEQRYQKQVVEADEYAKDLRACFTLIHRIMSIEQERPDDDERQKLVAVGALDDIHYPIGLLETDSELWQLSEICEDAEVYPEEGDGLRKTPAVEKRSQMLNSMLMREGYEPVFMQMDEQMQLIMGNALMRAMARQACPEDWRIKGYRRVAGVIEAGDSLRENGLLESGLEALAQQWDRPVVSLKALTEANTAGEIAHDHGS